MLNIFCTFIFPPTLAQQNSRPLRFYPPPELKNNKEKPHDFFIFLKEENNTLKYRTLIASSLAPSLTFPR